MSSPYNLDTGHHAGPVTKTAGEVRSIRAFHGKAHLITCIQVKIQWQN